MKRNDLISAADPTRADGALTAGSGAHPPFRAASAGPRGALDAVARAVQRRLCRVYFCRALKRHVWAVLLTVPLVIALRLGGIHIIPEWVIALSALGLWALIALVHAARRLPGAYPALAAWDAAGERHDALSSAYIFERELDSAGEESDPGRMLHVESARRRLIDQAGQLDRDLPLPRMRWTWAAPAAAVAILLVPWLKPDLPAGELPLSESMLASARTEGERLLSEDAKKLPPVAELTEEEKRRLEELRKSLEAAAHELQHADGKTPRDVLAELERRAREAEELAREIGADDSAWASKEMIEEMRKHPDTADLALAIGDKNAGRSADESRKLGGQLKDPQLTSETGERVKTALDRTMQKAGEPDRKKMVGQHVGEADREMKDEKPAQAGEEFEKLAEKFQRLEQRENAQKELEKLAERLRQSGGSIMGQNTEGMKKLAGNQAKAGQSAAMPDMTPLSQLDAQRGDSETLPIPGLDGMPEMKPGKGRGSVIPGTGKLPRNAKSLTLIPGTVDKPEATLSLAVPIPGTMPSIVVPGPAPPGDGDQAIPGGLLAGRGHIPSANNSTKPNAAAAQGEVAVAAGNDGDSFMRTIEGQPHDEAAVRAAKKTAAEFIKVQEEAFDEKSLPPSRREPVRRYFEALRGKFAE